MGSLLGATQTFHSQLQRLGKHFPVKPLHLP